MKKYEDDLREVRRLNDAGTVRLYNVIVMFRIHVLASHGSTARVYVVKCHRVATVRPFRHEMIRIRDRLLRITEIIHMDTGAELTAICEQVEVKLEEEYPDPDALHEACDNATEEYRDELTNEGWTIEWRQ